MTDRKSWFIDFAKIAGRKNLRSYFIGVIKSVLCDHSEAAEKVREIRNAMDSLDAVFNDESLPWDVADIRKAPAPTEAEKKIF